MAQDNRKRKTEDSDPVRQDIPDTERSQYGDHPFLGSDRQSFTKELLRFPARPAEDPIIPLPSDPARDAVRKAFDTPPHDPALDYQPPNPKFVVPPPNLSMEILSASAGLLSFALFVGLMFYHWMSPLPRYPGEPRQTPTLSQLIP
jgi:hypothetical protein